MLVLSQCFLYVLIADMYATVKNRQEGNLLSLCCDCWHLGVVTVQLEHY